MITINGNEYRNLEEQVQANKNDIARIYEGDELLARFGIKVVGKVPSDADLPNAATYAGAFGDAYLVGTETPYDYYIYTRPFEGEEDPQWFNLGPFPVAGPKGDTGEQGPAGEQGKRGSQWFSGSSDPGTVSGYEIGDVYFNTSTGYIWHLHNVSGVPRWLREANIIGPQGPVGPQGPQGEQGPQGIQGIQGVMGPAGRTVAIKGILNSLDELNQIDPATAPRDSAYLVQIGSTKYLYIITEVDEDTYRWTDTGPFNAGTVVSVGGTPVAEWDANTKLNTGASMTYALNQGLRIYKMDGGSRTGTYASLRQDGIVDVRDGTKSTQVGVGSMTVNGGGTGNSTRYTVNEILTKGVDAASWNTLKIPTTKSGTLATTDDITRLINSLVPDIIAGKITSKGEWLAAGTDRSYTIQGGGSIILYRANADNEKIRFTIRDNLGKTEIVESQMMLIFVPKETYSGTNKRVWVIAIDKGTLGLPSVDASTYNMSINYNQILQPTSNGAVDRFIMSY